jgi:hypothetical protein
MDENKPDKKPDKKLLEEFLFREGIKAKDLKEAVDFVDQSGNIYNHEPAGIREFIESDEFLDAGDGVWPVIMDELEEINSGKYVELLLTGSIGSAKALDVNTPIPTPKGWTDMGELRDGDEVYSETGEVCKVMKAWPIMYGRPCYQVTFSDNTTLIADEEHLWYTETASQRANKSKGEVITTKDILNSINKKHGILINKVIDCLDKEPYGIEPYTLGAWLGDGGKDTGRIWSADKEVLDEIRKYYHLTEQQNKGLKPHTIHGITRTLRKYNLINNKHIPEIFFRGSEKTRLSLLQGLIDTDGTVSKKTGRVTFTNTNINLAEGVAQLVRSLGMQCRLKEYLADLYGNKFKAYQVSWTPIGVQVCRLPRKAKYLKTDINRASNQRYKIIKSIEPVESRPVRCITVDSDSRLYLAGDGFTPTHNTTVAIYTLVYQLYLISCLEKPHEVFGQDKSAELMIIFQNINEPLAKIPYKRFRSIITKSPYFRDHFPYNKELESEMQFPHNIVVKPVGGSMTAVLGQNVIMGLLDEVNFMEIVEKSKKEAEGKRFDQAEELYTTIVMRRKSRFLDASREGRTLPGIFCMASSKRYPGQFTDRKQKEAETDHTIYVYDKRIWEVKPKGTFGEGRFQVYIGDPSHLPRIIHGPDGIEPFMDGLIDEIPLEFKSDFEKNIFKALKDIGGRSTRVNNPFIVNLEILRDCFGTVENILSREGCDFKDSTVLIYPNKIEHIEQKRFAHIDLGVTGDSAGLAIGHVPGFARITRSGNEESELMPVIQFDVILEIFPPVNGEVNFAKIRDLLHKLREQLGMDIKWLSMDSYQSRDTLQIMASKGVLTGLQSIDRTPEPMSFLKSAFMDNRINAPHHAKALQEAEFLQVDEMTGKVDHPPGGSSDVIQAMAGVVYGISRQSLIWAEHNIGLEEMVQFGQRYSRQTEAS